METFQPVQLHEKDTTLKKIIKHKSPTDDTNILYTNIYA